MIRLWSGLSSLSKRLIGVGTALLLTMAVAVGVTMWDLRRVALTDAHQNAGKLGIAIAEQTSRSMQAVDLILEDFQKQISTAGIETPELFRAAMSVFSIHQRLKAKDDALPQADAFSIIDTDGKLVNFSRQWPIPPTDLSDRDYYLYLRDHDDARTFISKPVQNRGNGEWTAYVVRRVNSRSGQFLGLFLGAIDLPYFREFYQALTVGAGTTVTLLRKDGTVLTSYPPTAKVGEMLPATSKWHGIVATGPASFETQGVLAPGLRIVSVHPLADYPLVVNVSVSVSESLANWRRAALLAVVGTASAVLCAGLLLRALMLQVQRLERSESFLAQQNARLEATQQRIETQAAALRASERHLAEKSTALETTLDHMDQGIMMVTADLVVAVCNRRAMEMLDLPPVLIASHPTFDAVVAHQRSIGEFNNAAALPAHVGAAKLLQQPLTYERKRPDGRILEIQSVPLADGGMVRTYTDTTQRRASEDQVRYFAHHDDLTKLVNRVVFQERLQHAIELADRSQRTTAVLYLDLDRFKLINDTRGHAVGDKLLIEVARRLRGCVRDLDTVARMGGDEFAIIQPLIDQPSASSRLAERVLHVITQPFDLDGARCTVGVSIGVAHYPDHAQNAGDLLRNADVALYRAKAEGRGVFCIFEESMDARQQQLFLLEQDLQQALSLQQFELDYQPIVDAASRRILGFEALLRWRHPTRGLIGPADFIGLAESSGLIIPIGRWVLETACAEAVTWAGGIQLSVNLSPLQFRHDDLMTQLTETLRQTGLAADRLSLEVTEGLLLQETSAVLNTMSKLRALGVRFSLDDFGTAHAGLSYLRRFPFDTIKIDKSFVQDAVDQADARAIVAAVLGIGSALNLTVIAEGVETEEQLTLLLQMNCRQVQGYLTGRPDSAAEIHRAITRQQMEPAV